MKTINYALSGGNKTLVSGQAVIETLAIGVYYSGIVAPNVAIEVWLGTDENSAFTKFDEATVTLVPADNVAILTLSGLSYLFVQVRLVTNGVTVGVINKIDFVGGSNPRY